MLYNHVYFTCRKHTENGLLGGVARFLVNDEVEVLNQSLVSHGLPATVSSDTRYVVAYRLVQESSVYYSAKYKRVKARNSYTVAFNDASHCVCYGQIQFFVLVSDRPYAYINKFEPLAVTCQSHFHLSHSSLDKLSASNIVPIQSQSESIFIPTSSLISKCMFVNIADSSNSCMYVITFPNKLLYD